MTTTDLDISRYNREGLLREASSLLSVVKRCSNLYVARDRLRARVSQLSFDALAQGSEAHSAERMRVRDCGLALNTILTERADSQAGFSVAKALWDVAAGLSRDDLQPGFYADLIHMVRGLMGRARIRFLAERLVDSGLSGRDAAVARSRELDRLWGLAEKQMRHFANGLDPEARVRREERRRQVLAALGGDDENWSDWHWHMRRLAVDSTSLGALVPLTDEQRRSIDAARAGHLPFGVTPFYASLMDADGSSRDRAVRAQVIPPAGYVEHMTRAKRRAGRHLRLHARVRHLAHRPGHPPLPGDRHPEAVQHLPADLRLLPAQLGDRRGDGARRPSPPAAKVEAAIALDRQAPRDPRGADHRRRPAGMGDGRTRADPRRGGARSPTSTCIRIGTRTPVTLPMRITDELVGLLGRYREPGTAARSPWSPTSSTPTRSPPRWRSGATACAAPASSVYNQQVYTFFVSRRFEAAQLRLLLRRIGIDPYYTFAPKGKEETDDLPGPDGPPPAGAQGGGPAAAGLAPHRRAGLQRARPGQELPPGLPAP